MPSLAGPAEEVKEVWSKMAEEKGGRGGGARGRGRGDKK